MKRALSPFELDWNRMEFRLLFRRQHRQDLVHVSRQSGPRQKIPAMAARHVVQAPVVAGTVIKPDPASQMPHGHGASPVRIVLVPGNHPSMLGGLAKELVVPKTDGSAEQL